MADVDNRRIFPRLSTGPEYTVIFQAGDATIGPVRLQNISATGCGIQLEMPDAEPLEVGTLLQDLLLDYPDLPYVPLQGNVVRIMGKVPGKTTGYVLVGVEFTQITQFVMNFINEHVTYALNPDPE